MLKDAALLVLALLLFILIAFKTSKPIGDLSVSERWQMAQASSSPELLMEKLKILVKDGDGGFPAIPNLKLRSKEKRANEFSHWLSAHRTPDLIGLRVALDPGHFGGELGRWERRYVQTLDERGQLVELTEGDLALATAFQLKELLEKEGAKVFLTRTTKGREAAGPHAPKFSEYYPFKFFEDGIRSYFIHEDLRKRIRGIHAFGPHLTLVIHFNALQPSGPTQGGDEINPNFNFAMIPGAFLPGELKHQKDLEAFFRILEGKELGYSLQWARETFHVMNRKLASESPPDGYLKTVVNYWEPGVYPRNLFLLRWIESPIIYGETLNQNNSKEAMRLSKKDALIRRQPASSRLITVAQSYLEGIKKMVAYCKKQDCNSLETFHSSAD